MERVIETVYGYRKGNKVFITPCKLYAQKNANRKPFVHKKTEVRATGKDKFGNTAVTTRVLFENPIK